MRWYLVSGLNGFMSCESIQTSWFQVWFILDEVYLKWLKSVLYWKSDLAVILAMFEWSKLIGLAWKFVYILYTYVMRFYRNFMRIG